MLKTVKANLVEGQGNHGRSRSCRVRVPPEVDATVALTEYVYPGHLRKLKTHSEDMGQRKNCTVIVEAQCYEPVRWNERPIKITHETSERPEC